MSSTDSLPSMVSKALPPSILQRIFISFITPCHRHPHDKCKRLSCHNSFPLLLGKVCREWRDIAWKLPTIWIWINIPVSPENSLVQLQLVEEWLRRAADQPLTIIVRPAPTRSHSKQAIFGVSSPQTPEIFKLISKYSIQWKTLEIATTPECTERLSTAYGRTPILESVFIHSAEMQTKNPSPLVLIGNAPNLRNLHCLGIQRIGAITHPWTNLTSFTTTCANPTTFTFILSYAPNIRHLNIEAIDQPDHPAPDTRDSQDVPNDEAIVLPPHLTSLVIKGWHTTPYIRRMKAPSTLERLIILHCGKEDLTQYSFTPVIDFIDRAKCTLRSFGISVEVLPMDVQSLHQLFSRLHSVTRLYVNSKVASNYKVMMRQIPQMLDPTLGSLLPPSTGMNHIVLPRLEVLYYCTVDSGLKPQALVDMIKRRCKGKDNCDDMDIVSEEFAKLRVVRFNKTNPKVLLESLQEEIDQGLEISYDLPYQGEPFE